MRPAIIFIPGLLNDGRVWQAQMDYLAPSWDVTIGDTTRDDSIAGMAARILAEAPPLFALGGVSMGGYVALDIMRQAPGRVTHLILADTTARLDTAENRQRRLDFIALARLGKFKGVTPRLLPQILGPESLLKSEVTQLVMDMALVLGRNVFIAQQTAMLGRIDSLPLLPAIECRTAVIVGEADKITPPDVAREMAGLIPDATLHILPKAGHLSPLEVPEAFNQALESLLSGKG